MNKAAFSITSISEESINNRTNSFEKLQTIIFNIKTYTITIFKANFIPNHILSGFPAP